MIRLCGGSLQPNANSGHSRDQTGRIWGNNSMKIFQCVCRSERIGASHLVATFTSKSALQLPSHPHDHLTHTSIYFPYFACAIYPHHQTPHQHPNMTLQHRLLDAKDWVRRKKIRYLERAGGPQAPSKESYLYFDWRRLRNKPEVNTGNVHPGRQIWD